MTPEAGYLIALVHAFVAGETAGPDPPPRIDWTVLQERLHDHWILPALAPLVEHSPAPASFREEIEASARAFRIRNAFLLLELSRFLPSLEHASLKPVVLKGAALSQIVYPSQGARFFADLDILVPREGLEEACAVMARFGFAEMSPARHSVYFDRYHFHRILRSPAGMIVEVHWDLSRPTDYCRFDLPGLLARSRVLDWNGIPARVLALPDQMLHAASQAVFEGFSDLRRVLDTALLLRAGAGDGPELPELARRQGVASSLWVLLRLAREIGGVTPPAALVAAIRPARAARACLESLGLAQMAIIRDAARKTGLRNLVRWLCAPSPAVALTEIGRYLRPDRALLLAKGHDPEELSSLASRAVWVFEHGLSVSKAIGYQAWRLASHPLSRLE